MATSSLAAELELHVSLATGEVSIVNPSASAVVIDAYSIDSASGALLPSEWLSVADNYDLSGDQSVDAAADWFVISESLFSLAEASLIELSGQIAAMSRVDLGAIWSTASATDLTFEYLAGGDTFAATPIFAVEGDVNSDGIVDAADFVSVRDALGATGFGLAADVNKDGVVNGSDVGAFSSQFGALNPAAIAAPVVAAFSVAIPEPAGLVAMLAALLVPLPRRRR